MRIGTKRLFLKPRCAEFIQRVRRVVENYILDSARIFGQFELAASTSKLGRRASWANGRERS